METIDLQDLPAQPCITFVGRKNSGKTTLVTHVIAAAAAMGLTVSSIKHHGHPGFEMDIPGKDSYRHHQAGTLATAVVSDKRFGMVEELQNGMTLQEALRRLPFSDLYIVEGYRASGLPRIELLRAGNQRDEDFAPGFISELRSGRTPSDLSAVATTIPAVADAAQTAGLPCFDLNDVAAIARFVVERHARPRLTIALQAGGESRRMGQSKALVEFQGRPLIERMVKLTERLADELIITTNEPERLEFLLDDHPQIRLITDEMDERGALPGFLTAFSHARCPLVAPVPCDAVFIRNKLLKRQALLLRDASIPAAVPRSHFGFEPLYGVYRTAAMRDAIEETLEAGERKLSQAIRRLDGAVCTTSPAWEDRGVAGLYFFNANTPAELERAEHLARLQMRN